MAIVTGDRYLNCLVKFVEKQASSLLEGAIILKLNPVGLHYIHSRLEQLEELEGLQTAAPVDYLRAYISDLGDHRSLEQLRRILRLLTSLKVVSILPPPARDPTPVSLSPFCRLKVLELRGCDLSTSAARGLLDLRNTLEKIICYNSTDSLRHVFASRIANIKESPRWSKLTFVSCSCNGIIPMDESLQLLPFVETLDLSRNQFAKIDNLRKCTRLKYLDLGFNHLRTVASFSEVTCPIVKLILRNNALTTLRGIENMRSIEGLDISYNIISSFAELELLAGLPFLRRLWLEGNPICCARWYRAQVFSYFNNPDKLKLDGRGISRRESWKKYIILASRQKRPASYGFYSRAGGEEEGSSDMKRKKISRLACIEDDEWGMDPGTTDQESLSCESENLIGDECIFSHKEGKNMEEALCTNSLHEFQWMDENHGSAREISMKSKRTHKLPGESSLLVSMVLQDSDDKNSRNALSLDRQLVSTSTAVCSDETTVAIKEINLMQQRHEGYNDASAKRKQEVISSHEGLSLSGFPSFETIGTITSHVSSLHSASPPHYVQDILHRRHDLEEEFMRLSVESCSAASSDSDTSGCDEQDSSTQSGSCSEFSFMLNSGSRMENAEPEHETVATKSYCGNENVELHVTKNNGTKSSLASGSLAIGYVDNTSVSICVNNGLQNGINRRRAKRRLISLSDESYTAVSQRLASSQLNGTPAASESN